MQSEGPARFLRHHEGGVRGVAFSPKDRHIFASGASDGRVNIYSASSAELLLSYQILSMGMARNINGVRFTSDGRRVLAATTAKRLSVIDVERGEQVLCYDNCAFSGKDRVPLAADPICPHLAVCSCVNGKGLTLLDLRMPLPLDFMFDLHSNVIRDITFLHNSWPFVKSHQSGLVTLSCEGVCKVTTLDGRFLHCFEVGHTSNSVAATPEIFGGDSGGFSSVLMVAGDNMSGYVPDSGISERQKDIILNPIWKLRYTSNGGLLFAACDGGEIRRYRRYPDHHSFVGSVFSHKGDVFDMDISPYDEYLVTASKDKTVGVYCLGAPNHGWTQYYEMT